MSKHSKKSVKHSGNSLLLPDLTVKPLNQTGSSRLKTSISETTLIKTKPLKPSLSRKSWCASQKYVKAATENQNEDITHLQDLSINNDSDDYDCTSNLLRAKDSLEDLMKTDRLLTNTQLNLTTPSTSSSPDTSSPRSLPALNESIKTTLASKSSAWKSNEKIPKGRRNKEKKKKGSKITELRNLKSQKCENRDFKSGDEKTVTATTSNSVVENYSYVPYEPKPSRSVVFTNEVLVVYFNGEHVVCESKEPLKKELEQQVRNKEMRKGHINLN